MPSANKLEQDGYLAAFPSGAFDRLEGERGNSGGVVVPYYTVHKVMAGLLDAHEYLGNQQASGRGAHGRLLRNEVGRETVTKSKRSSVPIGAATRRPNSAA